MLERTPCNFGTHFRNNGNAGPRRLVNTTRTNYFSVTFSVVLNSTNLATRDVSAGTRIALSRIRNKFTVATIGLVLGTGVPNTDRTRFRRLDGGTGRNYPISGILGTGVDLSTALID